MLFLLSNILIYALPIIGMWYLLRSLYQKHIPKYILWGRIFNTLVIPSILLRIVAVLFRVLHWEGGAEMKQLGFIIFIIQIALFIFLYYTGSQQPTRLSENIAHRIDDIGLK